MWCVAGTQNGYWWYGIDNQIIISESDHHFLLGQEPDGRFQTGKNQGKSAGIWGRIKSDHIKG